MYRLTEHSEVVRLSDGLQVPLGDSLEWLAYQAWLSDGNTPEPAPRPSLAERRQGAMAQVDAEHAAILLKLTGGPGDVERDSWLLKLWLCQLLSSGAPLTPEVEAIWNARGLTTPAARQGYAATFMGNFFKFGMLVMLADGVREQAKARIAAAQDEKQFTQAGVDNRAARDAALAQAMAAMNQGASS